jgi:hypothetical protein
MRKNTKKYVPTTLRLLSLISLLLIFSLIITACGNEVANDVIEDVEEPTAVPPAEVEIPDQSAYYAVPHNVYDLGKGPNTACSGCHSPFNWDPEAFQGPPPSCFTCKFAHEEELRVAEGNPLVEEADWEGIPCKTCHEVDENGTASAEYVWFNQFTQQYDEVSNSTEICEKCHVTTTGNAWGSAVSHKISLGGSAHLNYSRFSGPAAPPQVCTDCHDPHDNSATPSCEDCHESVRALPNHILGKQGFHVKVTCMACHDSSGLVPAPVDGIWYTTETTTSRGRTTTSVVVSHSPTHEVLCTKCHFEGNPNGLSERTATGEIPMIDICVGGIEDLNILKPTMGDYGELGVDYTEGTCPIVDICVEGETVEGVLEATLEEVYGTVDIDYTLDPCPEEDSTDG